MAHITLGSASATVKIPECKGLLQYGDSVGMDPRYAADCHNALTTQGMLRPMAVCTQLPADTPAPIRTLARLYRRWYAPNDQHEVLIAAAGGQLYWRLAEAWQAHVRPGGVLLLEIGASQGPAVRSLFPGAKIIKDYGGLDRVAAVKRI